MNQLELFGEVSKICNLPDVFRRVHYHLYTNSNIARSERLGAEMTRLLLCKLFDETRGGAQQEFRCSGEEPPTEVAARVCSLFERVKHSFPGAFPPDERFCLDAASLSYLVRELQGYRFFDADRDALAEAFQCFWGPGLRGEKGQFFTPRNVVKLCVAMLAPGASDRIIDPACGSGGFLVEVLNQTKAVNNIFGIDKESDLARTCAAYLSIMGDGQASVFCADSLDTASWPSKMRDSIVDGAFDLVLTNPPFGARIPIKDTRVLKKFELGHKWKREPGDSWIRTRSVCPQVPQVLFIERCLSFLRPGGRMAIVLPDGVLGNPSDEYIQQFVRSQASILAVVSLAPETFLPSTHTKTSVLFLEKRPPGGGTRGNRVFMAIAARVGHDKNGKLTHRMAANGEFILDQNGIRVADDDLPAIAASYHRFNRGEPISPSHLGFCLEQTCSTSSTLIPSYYDPEIELALKAMADSGRYRLVTIGELVHDRAISMKRGNEVGSEFYGMGEVPFVRTSDIVNWEIKIDPVKSIPERIFEQYRHVQDVKPDDILLVADGTFLIGRTAVVTPLDERIVIQSHIRRIRCLNRRVLHPYLLLHLLNTQVVQRQIEAKTFVQATISTLGPRLLEVVLPIPKDGNFVARVVDAVAELIQAKIAARKMIEHIKSMSGED